MIKEGLASLEGPGKIDVLRILKGLRAEIIGYLRGYGNGTIMRGLERRRTEEGEVKEHQRVIGITNKMLEM